MLPRHPFSPFHTQTTATHKAFLASTGNLADSPPENGLHMFGPGIGVKTVNEQRKTQVLGKMPAQEDWHKLGKCVKDWTEG